mmetsp:Transcript_58560/g.136824  ORF Transcript_58560/g.136824 Transcript_58560/m.136824 type:complete len:118 (-) Transcript_58560:118-471(-)
MARKAPATWSAATRTTILHQENQDIGGLGRSEGGGRVVSHAEARQMLCAETANGRVGGSGEGRQQQELPSGPSLPFRVGQAQFMPMAPQKTPLFSPAVLLSKGQPEGQTEASFALVR